MCKKLTVFVLIILIFSNSLLNSVIAKKNIKVNPLVLLILPALNSSEKDAILEEMTDWIDYRQNQGYSFDFISLYEIENHEDPENIRNFVKEKYQEDMTISPDRERYLGLMSDYQNGEIIYDDCAKRQQNFLPNNDDFTIEFFFQNKKEDIGDESQNLFHSGFLDQQSLFQGISVTRRDNGDISLNINMTSSQVQGLINDTSVHHLAVQYDYDNTIATLYLDGNLLTTVDQSLARYFTGASEFSVGANTFCSNNYLGSIDELRISKGLRYNANFIPDHDTWLIDENTIAFWGFEDMSDDSEYFIDKSGNAYDLKSYNGLQSKNGSLIYGKYLSYEGAFVANDADLSEYVFIPRYFIHTNNNDFLPSDLPYGFMEEKTTNYNELDFQVFRVPLRDINDFKILNRSIGYENSEYKSDLTLVSGEIVFPGDSSFVNCINSKKVKTANKIFKISDSKLCRPDYLLQNENKRLASFLTGDPDKNGRIYNGGVIYNISHGDSIGVYFKDSQINLGIPDLSGIANDKYNIYLSLACSNDALSNEENLTKSIFYHSGAAAISSSINTTVQSHKEITIAETDMLPLFFDQGYNLGQSLHQLRKKYYNAYTKSPKDFDADYYLDMIFSFNVYGDLLITIDN